MSADNYLTIRERDGRWQVLMGFMSLLATGCTATWVLSEWPTRSAAAWAVADVLDVDYVEYGYLKEENEDHARKIKDAGREEVRQAIREWGTLVDVEDTPPL